MVGTVLGGRYELLELIGTGGMANVYKARCRTLNRYVAIKILKDEYKNNSEFVKKFYVESRSAASLSNVNIVSIYDVGEENGIYYIVMELVEGVILKDVIKKNGPLKWEVALNCSLQILNALECAHRNGIVHRDIKPQNIIATYDGVLKVADFGIAKAVNGNDTKKMDDNVIGSVHYISPEQAKGIMIDARSDIYSLGIVMYEMLTGKLPFEGENLVSVALMHLNSEPPFIKDVNISVPLELANIVHKAMSRDIAHRYQSAREMINDLTEFKRKETAAVPNFEVEATEDTRVLVEASKNHVQMANCDGKSEATTVKKKIPLYEDGDLTEETDENESEKESIDTKEDMKKKKAQKGKKSEKTKQEKIAVYSAVGLSVVIIIGMLTVFLNLFFPSLNIGGIFKSKEYYLEDYRGRDIDEVTEELKKVGFKIKTEEGFDEELENNEIISQRPSADMNVKVRGTTVMFTVNVTDDEDDEKGKKKEEKDEDEELIKVPSVTGEELSKARETLENLGFKVSVKEEESDDVAENHVISQSPSSGTKAKEGESITLKVSAGKKESSTAVVPHFVGKTRAEAKAAAEAVGIMVSFSESDEGKENAGKVVSQSVKENSEVEKGTTVNLVVGREVSGETTTNTPATTEEVTKTFNIQLPSDGECEVVIKKDNAEVYRKKHQASEGKISVNIKGRGTHHISITVNGASFLDQNVIFE